MNDYDLEIKVNGSGNFKEDLRTICMLHPNVSILDLLIMRCLFKNNSKQPC